MKGREAIFFSLFSTALLLVGVLQGQTWNQIDDFPGTARDDGVAFSIGDKAYFGTGLEVGWQPTRDFYSFSLSDQWSTVTPMPQGMERQYSCGCSNDSFGFVFGGQGINNVYLNDLWLYDPELDIWTEMTSLPAEGRSGHTCFSLGSKLYIVGGRLSEDDHTAEAWVYNINTNSWLQIDDYPGGAIWLLKSALHGEIPGDRSVLISTGLHEDGTFYNSAYAFIEAGEEWSDSPIGATTLVPGRIYATMSSYFGDAVIFGGQDFNDDFLNDLWTFNWTPPSWEEANSLPSFGRRGGMMTSLNGELIYTAGLNENLERISETWTTAVGVSSDELTSKHEAYTIYPNPGSSAIRIQGMNLSELSIRFYSLQGRLVSEVQYQKDTEIDTSKMPSGLYLIEVGAEGQLVQRIKWSKY